jgi:secondary thiamine-phosphate synthase enzyme
LAVHRSRIDVLTPDRVEACNITAQAAEALSGSPIRDGIVCLSVLHTTCALCLNEDEPGLRRDIQRLAETLLNPLRKAGDFLHDRVDNNAQAHLTSVLLSPSMTLPLSGGRIVLGTWQSLFLVELDGPRSRSVEVTVVG